MTQDNQLYAEPIPEDLIDSAIGDVINYAVEGAEHAVFDTVIVITLTKDHEIEVQFAGNTDAVLDMLDEAKEMIRDQISELHAKRKQPH